MASMLKSGPVGYSAFGSGIWYIVPFKVDRMWGMWAIWDSCFNIPKAMFNLLKGDYNPWRVCKHVVLGDTRFSIFLFFVLGIEV